MNTKKNVLGRGLSALISTPPIVKPDNQGEVTYMDITSIERNPEQPRTEFDAEELKELSQSISNHGVLQPIIVRKMPSNQYQIVAGERRWRAAKEANLKQVPVIIKKIQDKEVAEIALIENIQRSNLNPIETAQAYQKIMDGFSLTQVELADRLGKERASIANVLRILKLPIEIQDYIKEGLITLGHAKAILSVKEPSAQKNLAKKVIDENLSVRALEDIVSRVVIVPPKKQKKSADVGGEIESKLRESLGTKVKINPGKAGKGKIEISYYSEQELDRLYEFLTR